VYVAPPFDPHGCLYIPEGSMGKGWAVNPQVFSCRRLGFCLESGRPPQRLVSSPHNQRPSRQWGTTKDAGERVPRYPLDPMICSNVLRDNWGRCLPKVGVVRRLRWNGVHLMNPTLSNTSTKAEHHREPISLLLYTSTLSPPQGRRCCHRDYIKMLYSNYLQPIFGRESSLFPP